MALFQRRRRVRARRPDAVSPVPFVGMTLLVCVLFLFGATALFAPWWVVLLLVLVWLAVLVQATRWWTPAPQRIVVAAVVAAVGWFVLAVVGAAAFGWHQ